MGFSACLASSFMQKSCSSFMYRGHAGGTCLIQVTFSLWGALEREICPAQPNKGFLLSLGVSLGTGKYRQGRAGGRNSIRLTLRGSMVRFREVKNLPGLDDHLGFCSLGGGNSWRRHSSGSPVLHKALGKILSWQSTLLLPGLFGIVQSTDFLRHCIMFIFASPTFPHIKGTFLVKSF